MVAILKRSGLDDRERTQRHDRAAYIAPSSGCVTAGKSSFHVANRSRTWASVARSTLRSWATVEAPRPWRAVSSSAASHGSRLFSGSSHVLR